jgi:hypothetical protein
MRLRHSMTMIRSGWEEIHAFSTPGEYRRFVEYIQRQVALGSGRPVVQPFRTVRRPLVPGFGKRRSVEAYAAGSAVLRGLEAVRCR